MEVPEAEKRSVEEIDELLARKMKSMLKSPPGIANIEY